MGVGKTTVCQQLKKELPKSVFLDGDWCWDASPFQVTEETKAMVLDKIVERVNNVVQYHPLLHLRQHHLLLGYGRTGYHRHNS